MLNVIYPHFSGAAIEIFSVPRSARGDRPDGARHGPGMFAGQHLGIDQKEHAAMGGLRYPVSKPGFTFRDDLQGREQCLKRGGGGGGAAIIAEPADEKR